MRSLEATWPFSQAGESAIPEALASACHGAPSGAMGGGDVTSLVPRHARVAAHAQSGLGQNARVVTRHADQRER